ncbi:MAG: bacteriohemerythrin [Chloroflexota bacterium]
MALQWTDDLSVGVGFIDEQHKELIARVNSFLQAMTQGKGRGEIGGLLVFLSDYVTDHFKAEEDYMARYAYPAAVAHKAQHAAFINDFKDLSREFASQGANSSMTLQVQSRVCDWLRKHIMGTDKLLGAFLKAKLQTGSSD